MITKLTSEQENKLAEYREKWLEIGLSTERINREDAIKRWHEFDRVVLGNKNKVPVVFLRSPIEAWIAVCMFKTKLQIGSQLGSQIGSQVRSQIGSQVRYQVRSQVWSQVDSQIGSQIESQVRSQIGSQVMSQIPNYVCPYLNNQFWAGYYGFYDFINNALNIKFKEQVKWDLLLSIKDLSWIYPFEDICFLSEKPTELHMRDGRLHKDGGPAWKYEDGFCGWSLNGVAVPQYLAETKESDLDVDFFKKEENADVRTEFVRKYGVERLIDLGKEIDSFEKYDNEMYRMCEYRLYDMKKVFDGIEYCPHLKMKNQSTGVYHVEAVSPECRTIKDALNFRFKNRKNVELEVVK